MVQRTGLFRSRTNKIFGGVASGIAYNLHTDPTLIRILFLIMALFWGGGVLIYLILWIALPEEDIPWYTPNQKQEAGPEGGQAETPPSNPEGFYVPRSNNSAALVLGIIFIAIGAAFLADRFISYIHFRQLWPIVLVVAGLVLIITNFTGSKKD